MHQTLLCLRDYLIVVDAKEETQDGRGKKKSRQELVKKEPGG
jgi:predicted DNA-binding protein